MSSLVVSLKPISSKEFSIASHPSRSNALLKSIEIKALLDSDLFLKWEVNSWTKLMLSLILRPLRKVVWFGEIYLSRIAANLGDKIFARTLYVLPMHEMVQ